MSNISITRRDLEDAYRYASSVHRRAQGLKPHGEYLLGQVACQAESGLAAFGYGVLEGNFGPIKVGPVSADLLAGVALHLAGFSGVTGQHAGHAHNFAVGLIDGYVHRLGIGIGTGMAMKRGKAAPNVADPRGAFHIGGTSSRMGSGYDRTRGHRSYDYRDTVSGRGPKPLTEAELATLAQSIR